MGLLDRFKKSTTAKAATPPPAKVEKPAVQAIAKPISTITTGYAAVLLRPVVTEKSTITGAYYFKVDKATSKSEIVKAFKARYGKVPRKVNVINVLGKTKVRGRTAGKRADWKKAVVYLNKGETVDSSK